MIFATSLASGKPSIELKLRNTLKVSFVCYRSSHVDLPAVSHVDQQSSSIGRSHAYRIFRTQERYVLSRGEAISKSVAKNLNFFWLTNLWWRSTNTKIFPLFQFQNTIFPLYFWIFSSSEAGSYIFWWLDLIRNIALSHFFRTFLDF